MVLTFLKNTALGAAKRCFLTGGILGISYTCTILSFPYITFKEGPCAWKASTLSTAPFNFLLETYSFYIVPFLLIC